MQQWSFQDMYVVALINQGPSFYNAFLIPSYEVSEAFNLHLNLARTCCLKKDVRQFIF